MSCHVWAVFGSFEHYKNFYAANANEDAPLVGHDFLSLTIGFRLWLRLWLRPLAEAQALGHVRHLLMVSNDGQVHGPDVTTPCQACNCLIACTIMMFMMMLLQMMMMMMPLG
ncbi:hypothetical protein ACLKA7_016699 [Drosophila subpalustris]